MNVLILGGTGYVGHRLTKRLLERGDGVSVVSRGNLHPELLGQVEHVAVNRQDRDAFEQALRHRTFDAVVDIIAYNRDDVESVRRALGDRAGHYLFTSSMAVYHQRPATRPLREEDADLSFVPAEDDPVRQQVDSPRGYSYTLGKRDAELALFEHAGEFPYTSLRAPVVVGPDDRTLRIWWFVQRILDGGPIIIPDVGYGRLFQVVTADDLVASFIGAMANPAAINHAYNIAQADIMTAEAWTDALASALGEHTETVRIPETLLAQAGLNDYVLPVAGRPGHFLCSIDAARRDLDFVPAPFEVWTADCARGCAASPPAVDSADYARRPTEIAVADRFQTLRNRLYAEFT